MGSAIFDALKKEKSVAVSMCGKTENPNKKISAADLFIIAVKPQQFEELARSIKTDLKNKTAISIMTGVTIKKIQKSLKMKKVVRTMPNLPLKVKAAVTGWVASKEVKAAEKNPIKNILKNLGVEIELKNEKMINPLTALSGCGPAYYFLMTDLLEKAAMKYGFTKDEAKKIAAQTLIGSGKFFEEMETDAATLVKKVASKGGSTEAALKHFRKKKLQGIFLAGVDKARKRADELSKNK